MVGHSLENNRNKISIPLTPSLTNILFGFQYASRVSSPTVDQKTDFSGTGELRWGDLFGSVSLSSFMTRPLVPGPTVLDTHDLIGPLSVPLTISVDL